MKTGSLPRTHPNLIGSSARRVDGVPKVTGDFAYSSDHSMEGMLWGHTVRSPHPHGRILRVDTGPALAAPGVHAVLTAEDVPGKRTYGLEFSDQPVLASEVVRHVGEPVALVAAEHPELARRAAERVVVEYEALPALTDMEEAIRDGSAPIHPWGNVVRHIRILHGNPEAPADVSVEGYYETASQDQAPLGPESGLAVPASDGGVDLYVATQWIHLDRRQIAPCLALPAEKVRVHQAGIGGAFGAREDLHIQLHACLLAIRTGRPVKMSYGREESFLSHVHRHPARIWMSHGATRGGELVRVKARILVDGGAYTSTSPAVILVASTLATGPYEVPNALIEGTAVYTNNPPNGAMRGFGAVQACFAHEAQMDRLAEAVGQTPVEIRLRNAARTGSVLPTGQVVNGSAPVRELIRRAAAAPMPVIEPAPGRRRITYPGGAGNVSRGEAAKIGVGYAVGYKNMSYSGGADDYSTATVRLYRGLEGPVVEVLCAASEVGQGIHTVLAQIARSELGVRAVLVDLPDTATMASAGPSSASRQTVMSGGAVRAACAAVREQLFARVRERSPDPGGALTVANDEVRRADGPIGPVEAYLDQPIEVTEVFHHRPTEPFGQDGQGDIHVAFGFAAHRAVVEVDEDLGLVKVLQVAAVHDVGRALNPLAVVGQIEGGTAQGLGLAVMEEVQVREGRIANPSFTDYLIPTMMDMPDVVTELVEEPEPGLPFGAKGVAEHSTVVAPAAIAAAIRNAVGRPMNRIPVRPDDVVGLSAQTRPAPPPSPSVPGPRPMPEYFGLASGREVPL
jgi:xanthine dehydrogenase D subunit